MTAAANSSVASVKVAGREYPLTSEPRCRVCQSRYRFEIEQQTVAGRTWRHIVADLPEDAGLSVSNLREHWSRGHLPVHEVVVQEQIERQAEERGEVVGAAAERILDHLEFAAAVIGRVNARLLAGEVEPTVRDALSAADLIARYQPADPGVDEADIVQAFIVYHDTAAQLMPPEMFREFGRRLVNNEVLRELSAKAAGRAPSSND